MQCRYHTLSTCCSESSVSLPILRLLVRVSDRIVLPQIYLLPLLGNCVLYEYFLHVVSNELPSEPWIPELAGNAEIFAAASESCGFAAFDCRGNTFWGEEVLFTASDGHQSVGENVSIESQEIAASNGVLPTYLPRATSAYSLVTAFAVTIVSPLGARPQPPGPKA